MLKWCNLEQVSTNHCFFTSLGSHARGVMGKNHASAFYYLMGTNMNSPYLIKLVFNALDFFFNFMQMTSRLLENQIKFIYHAVTNLH